LPSNWDDSRAKPTEGWIWTSPTKGGHVESSSLKKQHARTFELQVSKAAEPREKPVRPFVLYSLRHTFLTRPGESGREAWTLARIAGHRNVSMSSRHVHPSDDAVLTAMANLGRHNNGRSADQQQLPPVPQGQGTQ
jgi:integrase